MTSGTSTLVIIVPFEAATVCATVLGGCDAADEASARRCSACGVGLAATCARKVLSYKIGCRFDHPSPSVGRSQCQLPASQLDLLSRCMPRLLSRPEITNRLT